MKCMQLLLIQRSRSISTIHYPEILIVPLNLSLILHSPCSYIITCYIYFSYFQYHIINKGRVCVFIALNTYFKYYYKIFHTYFIHRFMLSKNTSQFLRYNSIYKFYSISTIILISQFAYALIKIKKSNTNSPISRFMKIYE